MKWRATYEMKMMNERKDIFNEKARCIAKKRKMMAMKKNEEKNAMK